MTKRGEGLGMTKRGEGLGMTKGARAQDYRVFCQRICDSGYRRLGTSPDT